MSESFWTPERKRKLTDLWVAGYTMQEIADQLGAKSRNAVSGQITKLGLVGKGGSGPGGRGVFTKAAQRRDEDLPVFAAVDKAFRIAMGREPDHRLAEHRAAIVLLAAIVSKRDPHHAARYARVNLDDAKGILGRAARFWPEGSPAPLQRWERNGMLRVDAVVCAG